MRQGPGGDRVAEETNIGGVHAYEPPRTGKFTGTERRLEGTRGGGRGDAELLLNRYRASVCGL